MYGCGLAMVAIVVWFANRQMLLENVLHSCMELTPNEGFSLQYTYTLRRKRYDGFSYHTHTTFMTLYLLYTLKWLDCTDSHLTRLRQLVDKMQLHGPVKTNHLGYFLGRVYTNAVSLSVRFHYRKL